MPPSTVSLSWNADPFADGYRIYETTDRLDRFPWTVLGETNATTFEASGHLDDSRPHFYLVRAMFGGVEGANSTIAAKTPIDVPFDPSRTNVYPFSLPDRSPYAHASDIAADLTSTNVDVLEKWDSTNHTFLPYVFFRGAWRGIDFPIRPGDGLLLGAKRAFEWVVVGTDANYPRVFTVSPPSSTDRQWVSLPYASAYRTASAIVLEIEGSLGSTADTRITEVGTWDPIGQRLVQLRWTPAGWIGVDFAIRAGDPVYLRVVSDFSWIPRLVSPEVP